MNLRQQCEFRALIASVLHVFSESFDGDPFAGFYSKFGLTINWVCLDGMHQVALRAPGFETAQHREIIKEAFLSVIHVADPHFCASDEDDAIAQKFRVSIKSKGDKTVASWYVDALSEVAA